ncbi:MAG TPA: tyrosine--tRNA ligase [Desulfobacteraceae bacterium]|nr:tyrosine--tRNA ligase [Desulfobacteraceae bacterium]
MDNVFEIFEERGFIEQATDPEMVRERLEQPTTCYVGFDSTARSLHVGHLLPIMSLVHMQRGGHRPIALIGGGTTLVGDPSGKTEARPVLSREEVDANADGIRLQLSRFLDFEQGGALMLNNADWLTRLNYIDFLRDIGRHFSVNRMLAAESYRQRLETGLSFIEFNYMLLQAYDFWRLFVDHDCRIQMGGNDQWGNILAGADLIRRLEGGEAYGITFPLLTTSSGVKMGKTHKGAVWLDPEMTSPYDYYQYWINQDDRDVRKFLSVFTLLPMGNVDRLCSVEGEQLRDAKEVLAFEATALCHGKKEAEKAREASRRLFGNGDGSSAGSVPTFHVSPDEIRKGIPAYLLFEQSGLRRTRAEARRLIAQGGAYINGEKISVYDRNISIDDMVEGHILLRAGKKKYMKVVLA